MDESIEIEVKAKGIPELRSELKSLKSDLANATDPADIERLSMAAGTLADKITDINEKVAIFSAGSDFEKVNNGLSLVSDQLSNMDFEGASESAKLLTANIKNMNPAEIANGFKAFAGTIGELSKAFVQMGLKLLANPLFLLVAIIGGIVIAIVMLKDKIGILQKAFDMMMLPINLVIQALKDLGDMMGLTAFAAEESADRQIAATERTSKSIKNTTDKNIAQLDREIARRKANGEDVTKLELKKQQEIENGARAEINNQKKKITELENFKKKNDGKLSKEKQDELIKAIEENNKQVEVVKNAMNEKDVITISKNKQIRDNNDKASKEALDKQKQNSDKNNQQYEAQKQKLVDIEKKFNNEIADLNVNTESEKLALQKEREQDELNLLKSKGLDIEKAQNEFNEKYKILEKQLEDSKTQMVRDANDERYLLNKKFNDSLIKDNTDRLAAERNTIQEEYNIELKRLEDKKSLYHQGTIEYEQVQQEILNLKQTTDQALITNDKATQDTLASENATRLNRIIGDETQSFSARYAALDEQLVQINATEYASEEERTAAINANKDARKAIGEEETNARKEQVAAIGQTLATASKLLGENTAAGKAMAIAAATIDTYQSAVSSYKGMVAAIPGPAGIAAGAVAAAASVATGLATVKKIISVKTPGKNVGAATPTGPPPAPSFNLFGGRNQGNEATSSQTVESTQQNQTITVNAIVSETAVTETQNRVQRIQQNAEL